MGTPVKTQTNKFKQPWKPNQGYKNGHGKKFIKRAKNPHKKFLSNARGFGKKGNYGRGTDIDEENFQYFLKILEAMQKPAQFAFERVAMANNVLEETKDKEILLSSNQVVSKAIEALLGFAGEEHLEKFFDVFGENLRPLVSDPYASHVLQKLVEIAFLRAVAENKIEETEELEVKPEKKSEVTDHKYNVDTKFSKNHVEKCAAFVERISKFLLNNMEDFVSDNFGNHLIRACVNALAGIHIPKKGTQRNKPVTKHQLMVLSKKTFFTTPETWHEILKEFPSRLEMWPQFPELVYNNLTSALLGVICVALAQIEKSALMRFGKKLLKTAFLNADAAKKSIEEAEQEYKERRDREKDEEDKEDEEEDKETEGDKNDEEEKEENTSDEDKNDKNVEETLPPVFLTEGGRHLLDTLLSIAGPKLFAEIYNTLFVNFIDLAKDKRRRGFYPIKHFLMYIKDKTLFEQIFDECVEHFDAFLEIKNRSIFSSLSNACLRLNTKQAALVTALQSAMQCNAAHGEDRPKSFLTCLLKVKRFEDLAEDRDDFVSLMGSLLVQDILKFKKPIVLVNCFLEAYPKDLCNIFKSQYGSYVADAFLKSESIGEKSREKLVRLLDGFYMDLAMSCFGSRALDNIFKAANDTQRVRIAKELTARDNKLKTTHYGRLMYNKLRLETFKISSEQWIASWTANPKKEDTLNAIVNKKRTASVSEEPSEEKLNTSIPKKKKTVSMSEEPGEDKLNVSINKKKKTASTSDETGEDALNTPVSKKKRTVSTSEETPVNTPNATVSKKKKKTAGISGEKSISKKKK